MRLQLLPSIGDVSILKLQVQVLRLQVQVGLRAQVGLLRSQVGPYVGHT